MENPFVSIPSFTGIGVYSITFSNGLVYVGSSVNVHRRIIQHQASFLKGTASGAMQALVPHGLPCKADILQKLPDSASMYDLNEAEKKHIDIQRARGNCLNTHPCRSLLEKDLHLLHITKPGTKLHEFVLANYNKRSAPIQTVDEGY